MINLFIFEKNLATSKARNSSIFRLGIRLMLIAIIGMFILALLPQEAEAKRMGGGRSFGKQSQSVSKRFQAPAQNRQSQNASQQPNSAAAGNAATNRNRWLGPIAGIAAGLGIAALLSHLGLGGALASMMANLIVIALVAFLVIWIARKFLGKRQTPAYANAGNNSPSFGTSQKPNSIPPSPFSFDSNKNHSQNISQNIPNTANDISIADSSPWGIPEDFDQHAFLQNAKKQFIRLQASWDEGNLNDIRNFTTAEMFADAQIELSERAGQLNRTEILDLEAELLGIEQTSKEYIASVLFVGNVREEGVTKPLNEVWNLTRLRNDQEKSGWLLAGIQQSQN